MNPRVFCPQIPSRIDNVGGSRLWVPTVNMEPAKRFGEIVVLMPPEANRMHDDPEMLSLLREKMKDFSDDDYVCCVGDPGLIAFAAITAAIQNEGYVKLLKWDRHAGRAGDYILLEHKL